MEHRRIAAPVETEIYAATPIDVLIVGAGIVGLCAAYYLHQAGRQVTVIDRTGVCAGASFGNGGLVTPSHALTLAQPGVMLKALRWMFDPESPLYIQPRCDWELIKWLWRFRAACGEKQARTMIPVVLKLGRESQALFEEIIAATELGGVYHRNGFAYLYNTAEGLKEGYQKADLYRHFGIETQALGVGLFSEMSLPLHPSVVGGLYFPGDAHVVPDRFVNGLARWLIGQGVPVLGGVETQAFETRKGQITAVKTSTGLIHAQEVVMACGAWDNVALKPLGIRLPTQPAKGYSVSLPQPDGFGALPSLLCESKLAVTPMDGILRIAGSLEMAGLDLSINQRRVDAIIRNAGNYLCGLDSSEAKVWCGLRSCTPDGLPIIDRVPGYANLTVATGHSMMGVRLGPISGKRVAELISGVMDPYDRQWLALGRF